MAPSTRKTRGAAASTTPPAKKVKTETSDEAWVDVTKPEVKAETAATPRGESNRPGKRDASAPTTPNASRAIVPANDASALGSPYPEMKRPTPEECWAARDALAHLHSTFMAHKEEAQADGGNQIGPGTLALPATETPYTILHGTNAPATPGAAPARKSVLDSLVGTILSQNTTDATSAVAFANLKRAFPTWEEVRTSPPAPVEAAVKCGGLAEIKVARIQVILNTLHEERGKACMEYLRDMDDESAKRELSRFKGVGPKTVSCVLMFCLKRADFPVDTHVWKIAMGLGWIPKSATRDSAYEHLNRRVPDECKFDLHVLLVEHGKVYKNSVSWLKSAVAQQLAGEGETKWLEEIEKPDGIKAAADEHFLLKSGKSVCG